MLNKSKNQEGFTLVELMIVVLIVSIGMAGAMDLFFRIFIFSRLISEKLTAAYLAQEGIEITRNIRDVNWLQNNDWDFGIGGARRQADYNDESLAIYQDTYLKIDNGFYNHDSGENSKFKREINIEKQEDEILIVVTVRWDDNEIQVFEKLYDWK